MINRTNKKIGFTYLALAFPFAVSIACRLNPSSGKIPIQVPGIQLPSVTQITPIIQVVPVTRVIPVTQIIPAPALINFEALANQQWQNTGLLVHTGDTLTIQYISGLWSPWPGSHYDGVGSGGDPNCTCNVMRGVSHAALIGKIGDSNPVYVGDYFQQKIGQSGYLFLGINDNRLVDNSGSITVSIRIEQ